MGREIKQTVALVCIAIILMALYFGNYLPFAKSQLIINSLISVRSATNLNQIKDSFTSSLDFYSPIGQPENVKQLGQSISGIISSERNKGIPKSAADDLINFTKGYYDAIINNYDGGNYSQNFFVIGKIYQILGGNFKDGQYFEAAISYYQKGLEFSPHRPQFLYGLFESYMNIGDFASAKKIGEEILSYWPDDEKVSSVIKNL